MAFAESLDVFLADMGVPVSFVGSPNGMLGILDAPGIEILGADGRAVVSATDRTVLVRTDQLGTLAGGDTMTVDAVPYVARDLVPFEDGAFTLIPLR